MTQILQGAFLVATLLTLAVMVISARQLIGPDRAWAQRELPMSMVVQGALLFCGSMYSVATVAGRLGDRLGDKDTLLYTAVFGLAAGALAYFGQTPVGQADEGRHRRLLARALRFLAFALPVGSGLIAGVVGPM